MWQPDAFCCRLLAVLSSIAASSFERIMPFIVPSGHQLDFEMFGNSVVQEERASCFLVDWRDFALSYSVVYTLRRSTVRREGGDFSVHQLTAEQRGIETRDARCEWSEPIIQTVFWMITIATVSSATSKTLRSEKYSFTIANCWNVIIVSFLILTFSRYRL
mgnify:CR=1 FL=1